MTDVDWAKFENYIKAKNISRNYKSELKTLINYLKKINPALKDFNDGETIKEYDSKKEDYDEKIKKILEKKE